jgi:protein-S-isoprenylcysteine O-methyltransferase Ste14
MTVSVDPTDNPGVIAQPPRIFLAALAVGFALELAWPTHFVGGVPRFASGALLLVLGSWLVSTAMRQQRAAGTNIETHRPTETIVSDGLYRFSRNPIYLGLFGIYLGMAVLGDSLWVLGLVVPLFALMHFGVILREERYLDRKFGDVYRRYRAIVRRWL